MTLHPTPYTLNPTSYTLHLAFHTLKPLPYTLLPAPYNLHPTLYTPHSTHFTPKPVDTLHTTTYTLHPTPFNPHPTPHTVQSTPHTLQPTPYTLNAERYQHRVPRSHWSFVECTITDGVLFRTGVSGPTPLSPSSLKMKQLYARYRSFLSTPPFRIHALRCPRFLVPSHVPRVTTSQNNLDRSEPSGNSRAPANSRWGSRARGWISRLLGPLPPQDRTSIRRIPCMSVRGVNLKGPVNLMCS